MVLVGLGVDERAKRMVEFLATADLDISLITFYGFIQDGQTLLARQLEVQARAEQASKSSKRQNQEELERRLEVQGVGALYQSLVSQLKHSLGEYAYLWPNPSGYTFYLPEVSDSGNLSNRAYGSLYLPDNFAKKRKLQITIQNRVVEGVNRDRLDDIAARLGAPLSVKPGGSAEILVDAGRAAADCQNGISLLGALWLEVWQTRRRAQESENGDGQVSPVE